MAPGTAGARRRAAAATAAAVAALLVAPAGADAHALVGRQDLPIPAWLFAWGASLVLIVSFIGLTLAWHRPRFQEEHWRRGVEGPVAGGRQPRDRGRRRRDRRLPARRHDLVGAERDRGARPELLAHLRLRHLLARAGRAQRPLRRRLPAVQPVARDRARLRWRLPADRRPVGATAAALSRVARALARGRRADRLRLARAGPGPERLPVGRADAALGGDRDPRLHRLHVRRDDPIRDRDVDSPGARPSRSTSTCSRGSSAVEVRDGLLGLRRPFSARSTGPSCPAPRDWSWPRSGSPPSTAPRRGC